MNNTQRICLVILTSFILFACSKQDKAIGQIEQFINAQNIDKTKGDWKQNLNKPPLLVFTEDKQYLWSMKTNKGDILIELKARESPMHVSSTIYLTKLGFYDNIVFHRIIPGFMAQGGDPLGMGAGGPGYEYNGEFESNLSHSKAGMLSMANRGAGTDGSQFFLTFRETAYLDGRHTLFGEVIEGLETLKTLETFGSRRGKTSEKIEIVKAEIIVKDI